MKMFAAVSLLALAASPAIAGEPDNLVLPRGFHASVVAEGVGQGRHLAVRGNDIYVSTNTARDAEPVGIIALRLDADHKVVETQHFSTVANGTSIRFYKNALYATSPTTVYRFDFKGHELVPSSPAQVVIDGLPSKGYPSRGMAFDGKGGLYIEAGATGNICPDPAAPKSGKPVGLRPCPSLNGRSGVWRFDASKLDQKFPEGGEQIATGIRDMMAVDWSHRLNGLYGVMQGRNDRNDVVAEELHRIDKGANLGWPYTYYDMSMKARLTAPEYGGDGKTPAEGNYTTPLAGLSAHQSPLDLVFYDAKQFPKEYRGGAFVVYHGGAGAEAADGHRGYDVEFVPFDKAGKPGTIERFAEGFAGPNPGDRNPAKAAYRPTGAAVGPDGSLYVVDGKKGRIWRIYYDGKN
ncbi:MAG: PQQ-dependent sugar dehydrogenase [Proteobacteria bacterium]|nr:PQQ-dependent sugar dehydrogenase [Pseudomonadota bacterium]